MKKLIVMFAMSVLVGCGGGSSPDNQNKNITEVIGNESLDRIMTDVAQYMSLSKIRVGYCQLTTENGAKVYGTFFGQHPKENSYICLDNVLKTTPFDHKNQSWVMTHEMCHYRQWIQGVAFNEGDKPHDSRSYEIECNTAADNYWYSKGW